MASDDLLKSWKRTEGFLLDARSNLSELAEARCDVELLEFEGHVSNNELELALDMLEAAYEYAAVSGSNLG